MDDLSYLILIRTSTQFAEQYWWGDCNCLLFKTLHNRTNEDNLCQVENVVSYIPTYYSISVSLYMLYFRTALGSDTDRTHFST